MDGQSESRKTLSTIREFDVDDVIIELLTNLKKKQELIKESTKKRKVIYNDESFIFPDKNGYPYLRGKILE